MGNVCPNSDNIRPYKDIKGSRSYGGECDISCRERVIYEIACHSEIPMVYDISWIVAALITVISTSYVIYCWYYLIKSGASKKTKWTSDPRYYVIGVMLIIHTLQFFELGIIYNGLTWDATHLDPFYIKLVRKVIQTFVVRFIISYEN